MKIALCCAHSNSQPSSFPHLPRSMSAFITLHPCTPSNSLPTNLRTCSWQGDRRVEASTSKFCGARFLRRCTRVWTNTSPRFRQTPRAMFTGGGFLGVGPSEIIVIVAVGWLLLGPKKLFALAKDTGKLLGQLSRTAAEARDSFTEAMELDTLASEAKSMMSFEGNSDKKSDGKETGSVDRDHALKRGEKSYNIALQHSENAVARATETASEASTDAGVSQEFLEQLKRVQDPNQIAPSDVPELPSEADEQREFERLEREYLAAKRRMERRKEETKVINPQDITSKKEER